MKRIIVLFTFLFISDTLFSQKWEDCCWTKLESGLEIKIIEQGKGKKIKKGKSVFINYIWYKYENGEVLDDALHVLPSGLKWEVGSGFFVKGFEEGLMSLRKGGKAFIKIPPYLAFGDTGIMGETTLCYYIYILE